MGSAPTSCPAGAALGVGKGVRTAAPFGWVVRHPVRREARRIAPGAGALAENLNAWFRLNLSCFIELLALALLFCGAAARADSTVTTCSEDALRTALATGGVVTFAEDCSITLVRPITIAQNITLDGNGHTVTLSGGNLVPIFNVVGSLKLFGVTLASGFGADGGGVYIQLGGSLLASNCTFTGNSAQGLNGVAGANGVTNSSAGSAGGNGTAGVTGQGGAIYNLGSLVLLNCTLATNTASGGRGGAGGNGGDSSGELGVGGNGGDGANGGAAYGGAVCNRGDFKLVNSTISGNSATGGSGGAGGAAGNGVFAGINGNGAAGGSAAGGGIFSSQPFVVYNSTFSDNTAQGGNSAAGGTQANGVGDPGQNGANASGGGLCSIFFAAVTNCTFYSDSIVGGTGGNGGVGGGSLAQGGDGGNGGNANGGGIYGAGTITVVNCTIANCAALGGTNGVAGSGAFNGSDGNPGGANGGGVAGGGGTFILKNSLLSTNQPGGNGYGLIMDGGYNLSSDASLALGSTDFLNANPRLGSLTNNGGPTLSMALLPGSPALNRIPPGGDLPATDQRGVPRPVDGKGDIGAYEFELSGPPAIFQQPVDAPADPSSNATFSVTASGAPPLSYQWLLAGIAIASATQSSFTVTNVSSVNAGPYAVQVSNPFGLSTSTNVFVRFRPSILSQPSDQTVAPGRSAVFMVSATGDTNSTLRYQWFFNGAALAQATASALTVANAQPANMGSYQVVITNLYGAVTSAPAALNLLPGIAIQPANQSVVAGNSAVFTVSAFGSAPLGYQWHFNGTNNISGATSSSYIIGDVLVFEAGTYSVLVTNIFGSTNSIGATLTVLQPGQTAISQLTINSNLLSFIPQGGTSATYVVEYKNALSDTNWVPLTTNSATMPFQDGTTQSSRFYRLR